MSDVPGLDLNRLAGFLEAVLGRPPGGPLEARLLAGGKSNLTYELSDGGQSWVVRRPPLGHVLATAHDMTREYRVMSALRETDVPVPRTFRLCRDPEVIGAPFYIMEKVDGTPYRRACQLEQIGPERTLAISERMIDTLATLHQVDPKAVDLSDFGRPVGFLERQVRRWKKQLDDSHSRDLVRAEELHAALQANVPADSPPGIVHGDYRLDNLLVNRDDRIAAVIDWEMATTGDPLTDVALRRPRRRTSARLPVTGRAAGTLL